MATVAFPGALFEQIHAGACVLCTGLRLAAVAGLPDWSALLVQLRQQLGADDAELQELFSRNQWITVAGYLQRQLGAERCAQLVQQAYSARVEPSATHRLLGELPFRAAVTTSYDSLLEQAWASESSAPAVYTHADATRLRSATEQRYVLKLHGDVRHREQLVFSRLDYRRWIAPNQALRAFLAELYRRCTLLLVGYHPTDPDFVLFLEQLAGDGGEGGSDHYAVLPGLTPAEAEELYASYRLRVIPYVAGEDPVAGLVDVLGALGAEWRTRGLGGQRSVSAPGLPQSEEDLAGWLEVLGRQPDHARAQQVLAALEQRHRQAQDWDSLVHLLLGRIEIEADPRRREVQFGELARVFEQGKGDLVSAFATLKTALRESRACEELCRELERLARATGMWNELLQEYTQLAQSAREPQLAGNWLVRIAQLYTNELGRNDYAIGVLQQALALDQQHAAAATLLQDLYHKLARWEDLAQLLRNLIGSTTRVAEQGRYRRRLAEVLATKLERPAQAIEQYQRLLTELPDDVEAIQGLESLLAATGQREAYRETLERHLAAAATAEEQVALCRRLAAEWEAQPQGQAKAAEYLERALQVAGERGEILQALARIYTALKAHAKLAEVYRRQIEWSTSAAEQGALLAALGQLYEEQLGDAARALEIFSRLRELEPDSRVALTALARLYERQAAWPQAVEVLQRLCAMTASVEEQAEHQRQLGIILHQHEGQHEAAEVCLVKALELKPGSVETLVALADLYQRRQDNGKAVRALREAAHHTLNALDRVKWLYRAAVLCQDELQDLPKALECYEELIALDPEHVAAGERLAALYQAGKRWTEAMALLAMLVRKTSAQDRGRLGALNQRLAAAALEAGQEEAALAAWRAAHAADATAQQTLQGLASLLFQRQAFEEAGQHFQALLLHWREALSTAQIVETFGKLGQIKEALGEPSKALNMYEKALELDPVNRLALEQAIPLYQQRGELDAVVRCKQRLLEQATDPQERMSSAEELGDLLLAKLGRYAEAIACYRQITALKPDHRRVLNKLMDAHIQHEQWDEASAVITAIAHCETDAAHRSRLYYTSAMILWEKLRRPREAVEQFTQALANDRSNEKAFDALKRLYHEQQDYAGLAQAYRRRLQQLPAVSSGDEEVQLWYELGELYQDKLHDLREAMGAFETAARLDPRDSRHQERLAQLYASAGPDAREKAIWAQQRRLRTDPLCEEAYHELYRLYSTSQAADKAWCVAAVLGWLKRANAEEMAGYREHRPGVPREVTRRLSDDLWWRHLFHEQQHRVLNEVFAAVAPLVVPMTTRPREAHGLRPSEQLQPTADSRRYARVLSYVSEVLDQRVDALYVRAASEQSERLVTPVLVGTAETQARVLLVDAHLLPSESAAELRYAFAKALALLRPQHLLYAAAPSATVLRAVALAVLKLLRPTTQILGDVAQILKLAAVLKTALPLHKLDRLAEHAAELRGAVSEGGIQQWIEAVECSVTRVALVLCDDLETAARLLATEAIPGTLDPESAVRRRLQELMVFAVSEEYFKLRELLDLRCA